MHGNLLLVLLLGGIVDDEFRRLQGRPADKVQLVVPRQLARQPQERFFQVAVARGRNVVVRHVFLAVEGDLRGCDLSVLDLYVVSGEYHGDVIAFAGDIAEPVGDILVSNTTIGIKHENHALSLAVVPITESTELLLSCRDPYAECDGSTVGVEYQNVNVDSQRGDVLRLGPRLHEVLEKGFLTDVSVSQKKKLEHRSSRTRGSRSDGRRVDGARNTLRSLGRTK